jgi:hypothetical protein
MVRALRLLVLVFGLGVLAIVVIGSFLPGSWSVERTRLVRAAPAALQTELEDLRSWPAWTPWSRERDGSLEVQFDGPERGAGARMSWTGQILGRGSLTLTEAEPGRGVRYEVLFHGTDQPARGAIELAPEPAGTRVIWRDGGELGWNPMMRVFSPLFVKKLASDFDAGLEKLAQRVEPR